LGIFLPIIINYPYLLNTLWWES